MECYNWISNMNDMTGVLGHGGELLSRSLFVIRKRMAPKRIYLEAQCYAVGYYEREGFHVCTEEFLEDGIPHVGMEL